MLWIGERLGPVERACILSVLRQGHPLTLWTYDRVDGVPDGVDLADARGVLPQDAILRHRSGSVSLFSNWFRYKLQQLGHGIWLDSDIYLLRPIVCGDYLLTCWEPDRVNSAPLMTPMNSPILPPLLELFKQKTVPSWIPWRDRIAAYMRRWLTGRTGLEQMTWGVAGPRAVTFLVRRHQLLHLASPPGTFHPYNWTEADWIIDPSRTLDQRVTDGTIGVHLWNERIKGFKAVPAPPGTFLARLQEEGA